MPIVLQNILIILLAAWMAWDNGTGVQLIGQWPVCVGLVLGIITGDYQTAMVISGTLQLMSLGVAAFGGSSIPEYGVATIVSVFLAVRTGANTGEAIAVGLPVGMLTLQLDILVKYFNTFTAHWEQRLLHERKFKQMQAVYLLSVVIWMLKYVFPITLVVLFGAPVIKSITEIIPGWVTTGLEVAGNMLPVLGVALLLHYMPARKYLTFLIAGFVLAAYLSLPILAVALLGGGAAYWIYQQRVASLKPASAQTVDESGDDYDE
ncbi:PTS sugar transporter subunit IIC [Lactobacillus rhamnosus]|uniref:PTS sugar transporter subunit IIC n=1 Tax=Lacticaseibacillus rhamnosus TaxID=47715 RepID=A0A7Y7QHH9_LACRH|nr:PTS sugar transporter subunit IIC [Lacticaseibacillus rhamnosus]NVO89287.1 PTS sugar transporter subunit IIC [Lacticaseibacillus rhamnosus]